MGLLDGGLQELFGNAFGAIFLDGKLHVAVKTPDGKGRQVTTFPDAEAVDIKGMIESFSERYRSSHNIPAGDVRIIILQHGVSATPSLDSEITLRGKRWIIVGPIEEDTAQAAWTLRGREKN